LSSTKAKINIDYKVEKFLKKEFNSKVDQLIFYDQNGNYSLFGKYLIEKTYEDTYKVTLKNTATEKIFYKLKHAVSWCIFDKRNMIMASNRIFSLDQSLLSLEAGIQLHQKLFKRTKTIDAKLIYLAKLKEEKLKKIKIYTEIRQYILQSDAWQKSKFL
jgi:hypothetical protein